jgi:hypothetical protein
MSDTAQEGYLALARQAAQGTAVAPTRGLLVTSVDLSGQTENLVADPEIGGGRDIDAAGVALGTFSVSGDVEGYLRYNELGLLLLAAGFEELADPVQDGTTGAWTHTFTPAAAFSWLTAETAWGRNRAIRRFRDCLVDELELSVAGNEFATFTAGLIGLGETWEATPSAPTYATGDSIGTYLGSRLTLDGLGSYRLSDLSLTIANNVSDDEAVIGQRELADLTPGAREVSWSGTLKLDGAAPESVTDLYRAAMYGSKTATEPGTSDVYHTSATARFGSPKLIGTSTTLRYGVEVAMPDVVLNAFPLEGSGADVIEAQVEGRAVKGASPVSTITLHNAVGTRYTALA